MKKHLAYHKFIKHTEKDCLYCDIKSDDTKCSYHTTSVSNLNAHKKRVHCYSSLTVLRVISAGKEIPNNDGTFEQP